MRPSVAQRERDQHRDQDGGERAGECNGDQSCDLFHVGLRLWSWSMSESFGIEPSQSIRTRGIALPCGAIGCTTIHARVARAIWPNKTAHHWAHAAGVKERMAKYWLAGHEVSDSGKLALRRAID